ncbi:hypothetical protein HA38_23390 [Pantoea allii]|nr:hypothetical protein HA38_23390 [Pantoea allii]PBK01808.1 hypothetical protein CMR03_02875 [Pantoea allii]
MDQVVQVCYPEKYSPRVIEVLEIMGLVQVMALEAVGHVTCIMILILKCLLTQPNHQAQVPMALQSFMSTHNE